jgi:hypothetical protein
MEAYNENLAECMDPGKYLCIDESMCQWLGRHMPNIKHVPRKPHPIGQEYKTIADCDTCCILRLDFVSDKKKKRFDDQDRTLVAQVKRLAEPWFGSGRTLIADSWFGSPEMATVLIGKGLFSIMQVCKRRYWPRGMPKKDMIGKLGNELGSHLSMTSVDPNTGFTILACSYRDKKPKAIVSSCGTTDLVGNRQTRNERGELVTVKRPAVFEDYETHKSKSYKTLFF